MDRTTDTYETRTESTSKRGNFYFGLGFALLVGLLAVVAFGVFGIPSLGYLSVTTAMAMTAIAITLLAIVSFVTLVTMRRTIGLLDHHETALADQERRHADLAAKVQSRFQAEQVARDRGQDADLATLAARQDAYFIDGQRKGNGRSHGRRTVVVSDPFATGQVHPVIDVEGIGEHYSKLLESNGVKDTRQLWNADATYLAGALKITPGIVENWQCMAELMAVTGIGKQYAELLVRSNVASIDKLAAEKPQPLLDRIHRLEAQQGSPRIQGNTIGLKVVESWIEAAESHQDAVAVDGIAAHNGRK
ncbi:MAG: hypothetical protein QOC71_1706 [Thermoplasmata archaeon]|nr:hypothetical protein [Thermoplasmata archaeon]